MENAPAYLIAKIIEPALYPALPMHRVFALYLLVALGVAAIIYLASARGTEGWSWRGVAAFCFPKAVFAHPSAIVDYKYFFVHKITYGALIAPLVLGAPMVAEALHGALAALFGAGPGLDWGPASAILLTLCLFVAMDFAIFIVHYWQHRIPILWEFHKVHHSAEVLTPITVYRMHPVDDLLIGVMIGILTGLVYGAFQFLFAGDRLTEITVFGLNLGLFLFYLAAYNLRHSHVWLHYPHWLAAILVSPAQHQIHHSSEARHFDKNMGFVFSFWDRLFGTLYLPKGREIFPLGLDNEEHREFDSVASLYLRPFRRAAALLAAASMPWRPVLAGTAAVIIVVAALSMVVVARPLTAPPTQRVHLEELTWVEARDLLRQGKTTALVPTGGTEQNGPHMVLGKHNYIVRHTAGRIAEALGDALVAPVIAYVPEGNIDPPSEHMAYAGTLTTPEPVFAAVLEHAARSLRAHGFKVIAFIGDSGGNQGAQQQVAARLDAEWRASGVRVLHVGDYYAANGQVDWLLRQGESREAIGWHASIPDTSELLAVFPDGVRLDMMRPSAGFSSQRTGVWGDPTKASAERGEALLRLKIDAALRQIRREIGRPAS